MKQNKMQIPEGYKNSALGIIPNDWEVKRLGEVCLVNQGLQIPIDKRLTKYVNGSYKYITIQYLNNNKSKEFILHPQASVVCSEDDILMTRTGNTGIVVSNVSGVFHNNFFKIDYNKSLFYKDYLISFLKLRHTQHILLVKAGTSTIPDLNHKDFYSIFISIPPLPQQQKIAEILGTWDEAIEKQSQLIDKLTDRKRGLMQQLLTGKKRLAGFSEEWKEVRLGEISLFFSGGTPKSSESRFYNGTIPFIKSGEISRDTTEQKISLEGLANSSAKMVDIGDILYALYGATSGECAISKMKGAINQAVLCIRTESNKKFILSVLQMNKSLYIENFLQGGQGNLSADIVKSYIIKLPSLPEQTAIANILTAADKEIELAKSKLELLRSQKSGLMQELLTGKIRVKI